MAAERREYPATSAALDMFAYVRRIEQPWRLITAKKRQHMFIKLVRAKSGVAVAATAEELDGGVAAGACSAASSSAMARNEQTPRTQNIGRRDISAGDVQRYNAGASQHRETTLAASPASNRRGVMVC